MDSVDLELETKCENALNLVAESRKRFGKLCVEYDQKMLLMENKLLNLQVETVSNYRFKPKNTIPNIDEDSTKDLDDLFVEISEKEQRLQDVMRKLKNTHEVIMQLDADVIGKKLRAPLNADTMLAQAKASKLLKP
ncbi:hypothetical protein SFRURICE_007298 [Spodoptera frugiperda]|uniref:SFRICE_018641 n=1 Tax=Spodoptera frugiperda TaxID=7108 RepID=A0A2H1X2L2_SPOFR|nr:uncharacterized protein LOC118278695 [Spodoptera frugiperda]KAF9806370.1 hypothetical protein SFRURICE_007298 [Spodoptera frugiperda]